jgi:hypothetical protein
VTLQKPPHPGRNLSHNSLLNPMLVALFHPLVSMEWTNESYLKKKKLSCSHLFKKQHWIQQIQKTGLCGFSKVAVRKYHRLSFLATDLIVSQFWRLVVQGQSVNRIGSFCSLLEENLSHHHYQEPSSAPWLMGASSNLCLSLHIACSLCHFTSFALAVCLSLCSNVPVFVKTLVFIRPISVH